LLSSDFNATAAEVSTRATNSGTFQVVVADGNSGLNGTGTYRISLAKTGTPFSISSSSDEGGNMVNGTTYAATIENGDIDPWTFEAVAGESIIVRMGETATASLIPWLRLYSPAGVLLNSDFNAGAAEVVTRATNSGTFLVVAGDGNAALNGTGNYRISLAKTGSELTISPNDEGGPLVNGTSYIAFIETGDIDAWSFQANAGDNILARVGEMDPASPLLPWVRLYGPTGILLSQDFRAAAAEVSTRATNGGTFLIVVGDGNANLAGTGRYRLTLAASGSPLIISDGDEGGSMNGSGTYAGQIDTGDIDAWTFTVCEGEGISASVTETVAGSPLLPWLRLYGRDGKLLQNTFGAAGASFSNFVAPETGTYQIVVADGAGTLAGSGQYQLTVNGLTDGLKFCTPIKSKTQVQLFGVGGPALGGFVLLSSQDVTTPLPSWTPVWTNNFDQFGVMTFTNPLVSPGSHAFFGLRLQ